MRRSKNKALSAILLSAGRGRRLGRQGKTIPKPLIPLKGKPVLEQALSLCRRAGVRRVYINVHHQGKMIMAHFGNGRRWGVSIQYAREKTLRGTGGAVRHFLPRLGTRPFLVLYGDNWFETDLRKLLNSHSRSGAELTMGLCWREEVRHSGLVSLAPSGQITGFVEKPRTRKGGGWVNAGVYVIEPDLARLIPPGISDFGRDLLPRWVADGRRLFGMKLPGRVLAIDTPNMLKQTLHLLNDVV